MRLVSALSIRRQLRRHRRRLTVVATVLALVGVIAVHHSGVTDMQRDMGIHAAVEMCLAVFTAVGAALVAVNLAGVALGRWSPKRRLLAAGALTAPAVPVAKARHGPAAVSVLCVSRR